ncbi:unnamed protein product [Arctia plantaginis]|uniref:Uncharacterized protein n=1 Tax=Arctia plantaginis TaxID=874455 RepID=A0A8S0Z918_ARCPL|nr:unnamed protein product [Arctia plantaginis]
MKFGTQVKVTLSATEIQTDTAQHDLDFPDDDSFWMETTSIDKKLLTPKFTRDVLSTLHQKSMDDRSDSKDEDIMVVKSLNMINQLKSLTP